MGELVGNIDLRRENECANYCIFLWRSVGRWLKNKEHSFGTIFAHKQSKQRLVLCKGLRQRCFKSRGDAQMCGSEPEVVEFEKVREGHRIEVVA
jgi:hypothetical protein